MEYRVIKYPVILRHHDTFGESINVSKFLLFIAYIPNVNVLWRHNEIMFIQLDRVICCIFSFAVFFQVSKTHQMFYQAAAGDEPLLFSFPLKSNRKVRMTKMDEWMKQISY